MLSTVAVRAGELVAVLLIAGAVLLAVAAAGVWWLKRRVRRRLEAAGRVMAGRARRAAAGAAAAGGPWLWSRPLPDRRWVAAARARRRLWRAVAAAERAVARARQANAPTGDLDGLCRRLRQAATDTDRALAMAGRATPPGGQLEPVSSEVAELVVAAGIIQDVAASAVSSVSWPAAASLAADVRREAVALSAGLASMARSSTADGLPAAPR